MTTRMKRKGSEPLQIDDPADRGSLISSVDLVSALHLGLQAAVATHMTSWLAASGAMHRFSSRENVVAVASFCDESTRQRTTPRNGPRVRNYYDDWYVILTACFFLS